MDTWFWEEYQYNLCHCQEAYCDVESLHVRDALHQPPGKDRATQLSSTEEDPVEKLVSRDCCTVIGSDAILSSHADTQDDKQE